MVYSRNNKQATHLHLVRQQMQLRSPPKERKTLLAIDLGSNSFHLLLAEFCDGQVKILKKVRRTLRLASGLQHDNQLAQATLDKATACLREFAEIIQAYQVDVGRVVGTYALRQASNIDGWLAKAQEILGMPIDIISGVDEAELIYQGVVNNYHQLANETLVIDIGGGSTEIILGQRAAVCHKVSLSMGCVTYHERFFLQQTKAQAFAAATAAASVQIQPILKDFRVVPQVIGTSGTIQAIWELAMHYKLCHEVITKEALLVLCDRMLNEPAFLDNATVIRQDRKLILPSGAAILLQIFESLQLSKMHICFSALREGLLCQQILGLYTEEN